MSSHAARDDSARIKSYFNCFYSFYIVKLENIASNLGKKKQQRILLKEDISICMHYAHI